MKNKQIKCVSFNIYRKRFATIDEQQRYDAASITLSKELFFRKCGAEGGKEVFVSLYDGSFDSKYPFLNYYYVLQENQQEVMEYISALLKNFRLNKFVKVIVGDPFHANAIFKKQLLNRKQFTWTWQK